VFTIIEDVVICMNLMKYAISDCTMVWTCSESSLMRHMWCIPFRIDNIIFIAAAERIEPSISREASSKIVEVKQIAVSTLPIQRTSTLITGTERRESHETNSRCLSSSPGRSLSHSINYRDDPTYADIKIRVYINVIIDINYSTFTYLVDHTWIEKSCLSQLHNSWFV
jgi:hypothetical protein